MFLLDAKGVRMGKIHHLIEEYGVEGAMSKAETAEERGLVKLAHEYMADEHSGFGFSHSLFCTAFLPHRALPDGEPWRRVIGRSTLMIEPTHLADGRRSGVPYGAKARLILIFLQSEAVRTRSRTIELGSSMRSFMRRLGISTGSSGYRIVRDQSRRIEHSLISASYHGNDGVRSWRDTILRGHFLPHEQVDPRQSNLFPESVELGEKFYEALLRHPARFSEAAIRQLKDKSMALDIYMFLSYRLGVLEEPTAVSWARLKDQFGWGYSNLRQFRWKFLKEMNKALAVYDSAEVTVDEEGLVLQPSPRPLIFKRRGLQLS
ncbi:MAG: replication protein RepA [Pseudomonadota bacterium]